MEKFGQAVVCLLYCSNNNKEVSAMSNKFNNEKKIIAGTRIPGAAEIRKINKMKSRKQYEAEVKERASREEGDEKHGA